MQNQRIRRSRNPLPWRGSRGSPKTHRWEHWSAPDAGRAFRNTFCENARRAAIRPWFERATDEPPWRSTDTGRIDPSMAAAETAAMPGPPNA